jgi:hypothetical protein
MTAITLPPRPPRVNEPYPSAPGNAGIGRAQTEEAINVVRMIAFTHVRVAAVKLIFRIMFLSFF